MVLCIKFFCFILFTLNIVYALPAPQSSVVNNIMPKNDTISTNFTITTNIINNTTANNATITENTNRTDVQEMSNSSTTKPKAKGVFLRVMQIFLESLWKILSLPKINTVLKNVATCGVNGAVEIITFYFPAALIPIIASAAGQMFPYEPVLMLTERLPVTSYRRAFLSALNSFLGSFDRYKFVDNYEYDPYMIQRFRRRVLNIGENNKSMLNEVDGELINKIK